ncbi:MAG: hypothetical protein KDI50_05850 [Candidatus Competibacteraceae bacterium]|nr:hypothetical protein [Candidatus Competibacteraceae bacterium]
MDECLLKDRKLVSGFSQVAVRDSIPRLLWPHDDTQMIDSDWRQLFIDCELCRRFARRRVVAFTVSTEDHTGRLNMEIPDG